MCSCTNAPCNAQEAGQVDAVSNRWVSEGPLIKSPKLAHMRYFGGECFDFEYYVRANKDQAFP